MSAEPKGHAPAGWDRLEDPGLFLAIEDLELAAHGIVEGALQGLHRSPFRGHGAEFDSHREYQNGDDLRYLDWNLFARHGRYFTKQFRAETNLNLYLLLDATASMETRRGPASKFRYAARAAAALALLTRRTHDSAGLSVAERNRPGAPPLRSPRALSRPHRIPRIRHAFRCCRLGQRHGCHPRTCRHRGIVVVFSDFFDNEERLLRLLRALRQQGHEVIAFQTLDPVGMRLPATGDFEFADLETGKALKTSASEIRDTYARTVAAWREDLRRQCEASGISWISVTTADSLVEAITDCLPA